MGLLDSLTRRLDKNQNNRIEFGESLVGQGANRLVDIIRQRYRSKYGASAASSDDLPLEYTLTGQLQQRYAPELGTKNNDVIDMTTAREMYQSSKSTPSPTPSPFPSLTPSPKPTPFMTPSPMPSPVGKGVTLDTFMRAISAQESGGDYNVANKDTGAHGKYQIMPQNWPSWSREAGLPPNAPKTPANQERVARFKIQQYYNKYGNWEDVASAWYSGRPLSKVNPNVPQGNYPSIRSYVDSVMKRAGR